MVRIVNVVVAAAAAKDLGFEAHELKSLARLAALSPVAVLNSQNSGIEH